MKIIQMHFENFQITIDLIKRLERFYQEQSVKQQ